MSKEKDGEIFDLDNRHILEIQKKAIREKS